MVTTPAQVAADRAYLLRHRESADPFDIAVSAVSAPRSQTLFEAYAQAGVTWWLEHLHGYRGTHADLTARITAGP